MQESSLTDGFEGAGHRLLFSSSFFFWSLLLGALSSEMHLGASCRIHFVVLSPRLVSSNLFMCSAAAVVNRILYAVLPSTVAPRVRLPTYMMPM